MSAIEVQCRSCGATLLFEQHLKTAVCPYCDSPSVVERPPTPDRPTPVFVLGFLVEEAAARAAVRRWIARRSLFAHTGLKKATVEKTRGVYLPAYLYSAVARSMFEAEIGENYQVTVTETYTDAQGNTRTRTKTETRTEWRDLTGEHATYLFDVIVSASKGVANPVLEAVEPFDLRALHRYQPVMVAGWPAEEPSRSRAACRELARSEAESLIQRKLAEFLPGDSSRLTGFETRFRDEVTDLLLLPVWSFALRYHEEKPPVRILVNGQTGKTTGKVPLSAVKITLFVLGILGTATAIYLYFSGALS